MGLLCLLLQVSTLVFEEEVLKVGGRLSNHCMSNTGDYRVALLLTANELMLIIALHSVT